MTETTPAATTPEAPPRLTFRHFPGFGGVIVAVTERVSKKKVIDVAYAVRESAPLPSGARVFHFFKEGQPVPRELRVDPGGATCTCKSGTYRPASECRHLRIAKYLTEQGVV